MDVCFYCQLPKVDPAEPPRYDVLNPLAGDGVVLGPYCPDCWPVTVTGREEKTP